MEITAEAKFVHISPKKVRPWLANLRRRSAVESLAVLKYARSKAGKLIYKLLNSAIANAINNYNFKADNLAIKSLVVDEGPRYKRYWLRSHGAADIRLKRMAHLKIVLTEITPVSLHQSVKAVQPTGKPPVSSAPSGTLAAPAGAGVPKSGMIHWPKSKRLGGRKIFTRTTNK